MTDRDNITLPREVVQEALDALVWEAGSTPTMYSAKTGRAITALRTHLAAPKQEHPGYVIGSHWLETAYSRVCAGEAEADVLRDMGWERVDAPNENGPGLHPRPDGTGHRKTSPPTDEIVPIRTADCKDIRAALRREET